MKRLLALILVCLLPAITVASPPQDSTDLPWVEIGGARYRVELALDEASRAQGLMYRLQLPEGTGMLFIHDDTNFLGYWMKNTYIPLDILYFDEQRRLVTQQRDVPPCRSMGNDCPIFPSHAPARYVLELNAGQAAQLKLRDGDVLTLGPGIPSPVL